VEAAEYGFPVAVSLLRDISLSHLRPPPPSKFLQACLYPACCVPR
jgi:hypothetical protein